MPKRKFTGPMDRFVTKRSRTRGARLSARTAGRSYGRRLAMRALSRSPYAVGAAALGYGLYRGYKYLRRKRRERRWLSKGGVMRDGIRMVNTLARYERYLTPVGGTSRGHNTDLNTYFLGFDGTTPTGTNYTSSFNNLRTLSYTAGATNVARNIIVTDIFANLVEGTADENRKSCSIDINNINISLRLINKNNARTLFRVMLVERIGAPTENGITPTEQDWFIGDMFLNPDDPCGTLDIGDSYWTSETTSPQARIYAKLNPLKYRIWRQKLLYVDPHILEATDNNWVTRKFYGHQKTVKINTGPFSCRYLDTDSAYKYSKPHLYFVVMAVDADKDPVKYGSNMNIDYHYEIDVKFKNLI